MHGSSSVPPCFYVVINDCKWIDGRLGGYWQSWLYNQLIQYCKIRANKVFALVYLYPLGGLEQIHCCERSYSTPSHRPRWNNIQHGELLHPERYLRNIQSVCSHGIIEVCILQTRVQNNNSLWFLVNTYLYLCWKERTTTSSECRRPRKQLTKPWREPQCCALFPQWTRPNHPTTTALVSKSFHVQIKVEPWL